MDNTSFTLSRMLYEKVSCWAKKERNRKGSLAGAILKRIDETNKLRDAQVEAVENYLWLKEVGENKKISSIIRNGILYDESENNLYNYTNYKGDMQFVNNNTKRFINRYLQDSGVSDEKYNKIMLGNYCDEEYEKLLDDILAEYDYPNYLYSLPMGSGKTYLIAIFIYIDLFMNLYGDHKERYASNFIILAPPGKKTSIIPSLKTIKLFNPEYILPKNKARAIKKILKIEVLDEVSGEDKLQNQNPNLAKIKQLINGHEIVNTFILNAEKIFSEKEKKIEDKYSKVALMQKTKNIRAESIKDSLSQLQKIEIFLDEAHHSYSSDSNTKKLREQLDIINKAGNVIGCIGMSGTPYIDRKIKFGNIMLKLEDIQDIVYHYSISDAIGNFLKTPKVIMEDKSSNIIINSSLNEFFKNFDITYSNKTKSKIAFYCPSRYNLENEVYPVIKSWYEKNNRNVNEILKFYSSDREYKLPKSNEIDFYNLDKPTSNYRVILLVGIATEGWDCRSLTGVVLPNRHDNTKTFVLQTSCRCMRQVEDASKEKALIYLDPSNYESLDNELKKNYHIGIEDFQKNSKEYKDYPITKVKATLGKLKYDNVKIVYIEKLKDSYNNVEEGLKEIKFEKFKELYPYRIGRTITTFDDTGLNTNSIRENDKMIEDNDFNYTFDDFLYEIQMASFGNVTCAKLYNIKEVRRLYREVSNDENLKWIYNHPEKSTYDFSKLVASAFTHKFIYSKEEIVNTENIELLDWDMKDNPTIRVEKSNIIYPSVDFNEINNNYEEDKAYIDFMFNRDRTENKDKSFNYYPYKMDSNYELDFLKEILKSLGNIELEIYYNGYKNEKLQSFRIETPFGLYTPDFLIIKRDKSKIISKVLIVETKGEPYVTKGKEEFIKKIFLKHNKQFIYNRVGNIKDNNEYQKIIKIIENFSK